MEIDNTYDPYAEPLMSLNGARHLFAYNKQAFARHPARDRRLLTEFERTLEQHELLICGCVEEALTDRIAGLCSRSVLTRAGIDAEPASCASRDWNRPNKMGLALFTLNQPLDEFLGRAFGFHSLCSARQQSVVDQVHELAREAAEKMAGQSRQITIWSLADDLGVQVGVDFMSNYLCLPAVREVLENYIENDLSYGNRAIQLMLDCPECLSEHSSFNGAMRSFRLHRLLANREDLHREALRAFQMSRT